MCEKTKGRKSRPDGVNGVLYTTEASESRKQSLSEQTIPDPTQEEAEAIINANGKKEEEDVE